MMPHKLPNVPGANFVYPIQNAVCHGEGAWGVQSPWIPISLVCRSHPGATSRSSRLKPTSVRTFLLRSSWRIHVCHTIFAGHVFFPSCVVRTPRAMLCPPGPIATVETCSWRSSSKDPNSLLVQRKRTAAWRSSISDLFAVAKRGRPIQVNSKV